VSLVVFSSQLVGRCNALPCLHETLRAIHQKA